MNEYNFGDHEGSTLDTAQAIAAKEGIWSWIRYMGKCSLFGTTQKRNIG